MVKVLAVIPARGSSKGIPGKNLVDLDGRPLISYIIDSALKAQTLDRVVVSTDDEKIAETARRYGAEVPFTRPEELSGDDISLIPVVKHAAQYLQDQEDWRSGVVVSLQPTSPLTEAREIDSAVKKMIETDCDSVVGICPVEDHPFWTYRLDEGRVLPFVTTDQNYLQRQDLPEVYTLSGALYVRKLELLTEWTGDDFALGKDIRAVIMSRYAKDIHSMEDLWLVEKILKERMRE